MDFSKVKLVITDMDGTLLNSKHQVSDLFFEQFKLLKKNNIQFVAASGRQYHSIVSKLHSIEKDITIVAENGAITKRDGKELFVNAFKKDDMRYLISEIIKIPDAHLVICGKTKAYFLEKSEGLAGSVTEYYSEYQTLENFDDLPNDDLLKIAIYHEKASENFLYPTLKYLEKDWQLKISGEFWLDIALKENHKGNAIARLQKEFGITPEETMVFGDYQNDLEMLKLAKYSFAMKNAHPLVKETASYETLSNDEGGVEKVLTELLEGRE